MARVLQLRRGTTAENDLFTGAVGELVADTTINALRLHDGSTVGGFPVAKDDLSNLSATGKAVCANLAMPGNNYDDLTIGASSTTYIAPADGYFTLCIISGGDNRYISLENASLKFGTDDCSGGTDKYLKVFLPAKKGDVVTIWYSANGALQWFRFIYAQGE